MIKSVFFDLDDTIFDFKKAEAIAVSTALSSFGITPKTDIIKRYSDINLSQWKLLEQRKISRERLLVRRFELLFDEFDININPAEMQSLYEKLLGIGHYFMPYAEDVIKELYNNYNLYVVSNGTASVQNGRIESSGIKKYFKNIFISQNIGVNKPQKAFFDYCFSVIPDFERSTAIIVGDSISSDIQGGINAGIKTCLYNPKNNTIKQQNIADYVISSLNELPKLLKTI